MTDITTSSIMALSALTPAAMFGYLGMDKFGKKMILLINGKTLPFNADLHKNFLNGYVKHYIRCRLKEPVCITVEGMQYNGYIRQSGNDMFTFYVNYNLPLITVQWTGDGWAAIADDEDEQMPKELTLPFILALQNEIFN